MKVLSHQQRRERRSQVADALRAGAPITEICSQFGVSRKTVFDAADEFDVVRPQKDGFRTTTWLVLSDLIRTIETYEEIGRRRGVTKQRVGQIADNARLAGVQFAKRERRASAAA
jgi:transposase-like protein